MSAARRSPDLLAPAVGRAAQKAGTAHRRFAAGRGPGGPTRSSAGAFGLRPRDAGSSMSLVGAQPARHLGGLVRQSSAQCGSGAGPRPLARAAVDKALAQPDPVTLEPGKSVVAGARGGRPVRRRADVALRRTLRRQGTQLLRAARRWRPDRRNDFPSTRITLTSDPADAQAPGFAFDDAGLPNDPVTSDRGGRAQGAEARPLLGASDGYGAGCRSRVLHAGGRRQFQADMIRSVNAASS